MNYEKKPAKHDKQVKPEMVEEVISLANKRFEVPDGYQYLKYYEEVDLLVIRYSNTDAVISKSDMEKGLIYNFDNEGNLTGIEVLDLYDKFTEESE